MASLSDNRTVKTAETNLWRWLSGARNHFGSSLHLQRVENSVGRGTPDVEGCLNGHSFWVELKVSESPSRAATSVKTGFEPQQIPWMVQRAKAGGAVFVLNQIGRRRYLLAREAILELQEGIDLMPEASWNWLSVVRPGASAVNVLLTLANLMTESEGTSWRQT